MCECPMNLQSSRSKFDKEDLCDVFLDATIFAMKLTAHSTLQKNNQCSYKF